MSDVIREREQSKKITLVETVSDWKLRRVRGVVERDNTRSFTAPPWTSVPALETTEAPIAKGELARRGHSPRLIVPSQATRDRAI
jgi:hypothetical protein